MVVHLQFCGVLPPRFVQYYSQNSCVIAVKLFLHTFSVHVVHPYSSIDTAATWKKLRFILSVRSDFHMTDLLSIAVYAFVSRVLMSLIKSTCIPACQRCHRGLCQQLFVPDYVAGFRQGRVLGYLL